MRSNIALYLAAGIALNACTIAPQRSAGTDGAPVHEHTGSMLATADELIVPSGFAAIPEPAPAPEAKDGASPDNVWDRVRDGFTLPTADKAAIEREAATYTSNPDYLGRVGERARPFLGYIVDALDARDLPTELALIPVVESAYRPFAYSNGHAAGLWQFVPATGRHYGLRQDWWYDGRRDFVAATEAALDYFAYLHEFFDGDWLLAIAAYNAGEGTVQRAVERNRRRGEPTDFWHLDLPAQTEAYVPRLLALRDIVAAPAVNGITLPDIPNERAIGVVQVDGQIDLALAADLAGITTERLYRLNPGYNRWATPPEGPHRLVLPADRTARFREGLAATAPSERMRWQRHRVAQGDTLGQIADQYHTSVSVLRDVNDLNGNLIRAGEQLVVPVSGRPTDASAIAARNSSNAGARRHTVQSGESLWAIAQRYDVNIDALAAWNGLSKNATLHPGDTLTVRRNGAAPVSGGPGRDRIQSVSYTVRRGDSLYRIARRFNVQVADLRRWNDLPGDYLRPGQRLELKVDVTRPGG